MDGIFLVLEFEVTMVNDVVYVEGVIGIFALTAMTPMWSPRMAGNKPQRATHRQAREIQRL